MPHQFKSLGALTKSEQRIADLHHLSVKEAADRLGLKPISVKKVRNIILQKQRVQTSDHKS